MDTTYSSSVSQPEKHDTFCQVSELGRIIVWLHTFGERMVDPANGRPAGSPRLPESRRPRIPAEGAISGNPALIPDTIKHDAAQNRLLVGKGFVENVPVAVWNYEVSGKHVLRQWFSYRQKNRERPIMGDRRQPSPLSFVQPDHWLSEYTTELINVLNVLGWLVELEPSQAELLDKVLSGTLITDEELRKANAFELPKNVGRKKKQPQETRLL